MAARLGFLAVLLVASVVTTGCLDQIQSALSAIGGDDPQGPPGDTFAGPIAEPLTNGYNKTLPLSVVSGHVRIVLSATLSSNPASPLPVQSPGTAKITLRDPTKATVRVIDLPSTPAPPGTPSYTASIEVENPIEGEWTIQITGTGLANGGNGARIQVEGRATAAVGG